MSDRGKITWCDITVEDAESLSAFYTAVAGWRREALSEHNGDFVMYAYHSDEPVAGVCYAKGVNAHLPPQWLCYVNVSDVRESTRTCLSLGGKVIQEPRVLGDKLFCVLQDPAGAYIALVSPRSE